jgi:hypothetical protein
MIEAGATSTGGLLSARPTGDSHALITRGPAQRRGDAKRRPRCSSGVKNNATRDSIRAGTPRRIPRPGRIPFARDATR